MIKIDSQLLRYGKTLRGGEFDCKRERGIDAWYVHFNTKPRSFELTKRLRASNKDAWKCRAEQFSVFNEPTEPTKQTVPRIDKSGAVNAKRKQTRAEDATNRTQPAGCQESNGEDCFNHQFGR